MHNIVALLLVGVGLAVGVRIVVVARTNGTASTPPHFLASSAPAPVPTQCQRWATAYNAVRHCDSSGDAMATARHRIEQYYRYVLNVECAAADASHFLLHTD
jgi:hypothetical protein